MNIYLPRVILTRLEAAELIGSERLPAPLMVAARFPSTITS